MIVDAAFSDALLKLQATADRLEAELEAMYLQSQPSLEALHAKTREFMEAYKSLNDFALKAISVRD
ncbi:hypothetical protein [Aeromonas salmonicida]|jgi:hypothetical protein|uniref:hypothetical protein n=1 Tax=Aeromonas salmonicida TaxID=645 RepID=UPI00232EFD06|nr:hypothetical protein [Aeromonas salmonicida]WCH24331.1 hypothetical protein ONZ54_08405 [Aeromonas salmonicida]